MGIRVDDISFLYERGTAMQVTALDHVSAEIPDNQFIGLIGHTGSGKSTFVQTLNGLLKVTSGHIYYNGEDIDGDKFDRKKLRSDVGLVFQYPEHQLFEVDVITDVMFGPRNLGLSDAEAKQRARDALESVRMPKSLYKSSPFDLSGGQKRRAAIAGVLAMRPKILILDEPTAGLDPKGRDEILGLIADMKRDLNMTIILVSHSMDDVARYVDRIMVMGGGKLLYDDEPVKVFRHVKELEELGLAAPQIGLSERIAVAEVQMPTAFPPDWTEEKISEMKAKYRDLSKKIIRIDADGKRTQYEDIVQFRTFVFADPEIIFPDII